MTAKIGRLGSLFFSCQSKCNRFYVGSALYANRALGLVRWIPSASYMQLCICLDAIYWENYYLYHYISGRLGIAKLCAMQCHRPDQGQVRLQAGRQGQPGQRGRELRRGHRQPGQQQRPGGQRWS